MDETARRTCELVARCSLRPGGVMHISLGDNNILDISPLVLTGAMRLRGVRVAVQPHALFDRLLWVRLVDLRLFPKVKLLRLLRPVKATPDLSSHHGAVLVPVERGEDAVRLLEAHMVQY